MHDIQWSTGSREDVEAWAVCWLERYSNRGISCSEIMIFSSHLNHAHYDIPPRMRVDFCDKITEPIAVNQSVLVSCSAVTLLGLYRVVQDSRYATTLSIHVDLLYSHDTFHFSDCGKRYEYSSTITRLYIHITTNHHWRWSILEHSHHRKYHHRQLHNHASTSFSLHPYFPPIT